MTFNQTIRELQNLINQGKRKTVEFNSLVGVANKLNPNPHTPVGFYLDGPRPYTGPNGGPVRD